MFTVKEFLEELSKNPEFSGEFFGELRGTPEGFCVIYDTREEGVYVEVELPPQKYPPGLYKVKVEKGDVVSVERVREDDMVKEAYSPLSSSEKNYETESVLREIEEQLKQVKKELKEEIKEKVRSSPPKTDGNKKTEKSSKDIHRKTYEKVTTVGRALGEFFFQTEERHRELLESISSVQEEIKDIKVGMVGYSGQVEELANRLLTLSGKVTRLEKQVSRLTPKRNEKVKDYLLYFLIGINLIEFLLLLKVAWR